MNCLDVWGQKEQPVRHVKEASVAGAPRVRRRRDEKGSEEPGPMAKYRFLGIFKNVCRYR